MREQQRMENERYRAELDALLETFAPAVDADVMRTLCAGLGIEFMAVVELYWGEPLRQKTFKFEALPEIPQGGDMFEKDEAPFKFKFESKPF